MKTMKRFLAAAMAVTSVMAIAPMSAFAENETGGTTNVKFNAVIEPAYTITIPASVNLNAENPTATIKAENVYLDTTKHKQINVTLDSAQYVETGASTFIAKTADGNSSVTYTIGKDTATTGVKVGDTVAEFTADSSVTLNFSEPTGATYAGTHSETLTFGISVEDAVTTPTVGTVFPIGTADLGDYYYWNHEIRADELRMKFKNFGTATISVGNNYSHPSLGNYRVISIISPTAQAIDWEQTQMDPTGPWAEWSNMPSYNYFKVDNYDTTPTGIKIASGSGTEDDPFIFELVFD